MRGCTWPKTRAARAAVSSGCRVEYMDGITAAQRPIAQAIALCAPALATMPAHKTAPHADHGTLAHST